MYLRKKQKIIFALNISIQVQQSCHPDLSGRMVTLRAAHFSVLGITCGTNICRGLRSASQNLNPGCVLLRTAAPYQTLVRVQNKILQECKITNRGSHLNLLSGLWQ